MATVTDIGALISISPDVRGGWPCIAGTGVSVHRIVSWYQLGLEPDEIVDKIDHLSLGQIHAALAYYHVNREQIEADLAIERQQADQIETDCSSSP